MPYKILVADDEPDTIDLCSKILKREGFEVSSVKDGIEAVKMMAWRFWMWQQRIVWILS